jgi:hypothetical protein
LSSEPIMQRDTIQGSVRERFRRPQLFGPDWMSAIAWAVELRRIVGDASSDVNMVELLAA